MHAATFRALGEPSRLRIVDLLRSGPLSVGEIVERLDLRQPQVSKHLRVLADSGIVASRRQSLQRIYRLEAAPFGEIEAWVASFERTWNDRLDRLGSFLHDTDLGDTDEHAGTT